MNRIELLIVSGLAVAAIAGCKGGDASAGGGGKTPVKSAEPIAAIDLKPGEEATIFPVAEGNQWTYKVEEAIGSKTGVNRGSAEATFKITKVTDSPEGKDVEIEVSAGGKVTNKQIWRITKDGISSVASGVKLDKLTPPQTIVKFPIKDGDKYSWSGTGIVAGKPAKMKSNYTVKGSRVVDTEMGQVQALLIESDTTIEIDAKNKGASRLATWYKPGTGLVRIQESTQFPSFGRQALLRLKSFSPKQ